jgi:hypothetical protein
MENTTDTKKDDQFTPEEKEVNEAPDNKPPKSLMISFRAANEAEYRELVAIKDQMIKDGTGKSFRDPLIAALKLAQKEGYFLID